MRYHDASISLENRVEKIYQLQDEIEQNLLLLGATGVEDKLQDGVPESIDLLLRAGIKLWVLTVSYSFHV